MPIIFHFKPEAKLLICVHAGTTPDEEFLASYKALYENDLFNNSMNRLIDLRQADNPTRGTDVLRQSAEFVRARFKDIQQ